MKRLRRQPSLFGAVDFADQIGLEFNLPLHRISEKFSLDAAMVAAKVDHPLMRGRRTEKIFEYVVGSLGKANLITPEDGSGLLYDGNEVQSPDYFVSLKSGKKYFIEIKNSYLKRFETPVTFSRAYLSRLKRFSELKGHPLLVAVYWNNLKIWTVNKVEDFESEKGTINLRFIEAHQKSIAGEFGDRTVAAVPPLICRIYADESRERSLGPDGVAKFTVSRLAFFSEGKEILLERERQIALYLMFHSSWIEGEPEAHMDGDRVNYIEFRARNEGEESPEQLFQSLGTLAGMISSYYKWLTSAEEEIVRLTPQLGPAELAPGFDDRYKGEVLRLWQFQIQPNYKPLVRS